jgi:hypothetical protein
MQAELTAEAATAPSRLPIDIGAITALGNSYFDLIPAAHTLPWLQDTPADTVWASWRVNELRPGRPGVWERDVIVLDPENRAVAVYNLNSSEHDLRNPAHYAELKQILRDAATP